jgi:hypothetical protein
MSSRAKLPNLALDLATRLVRSTSEGSVPRIVFTGGPCGGKSTAMSLVDALPLIAVVVLSAVGFHPD